MNPPPSAAFPVVPCLGAEHRPIAVLLVDDHEAVLAGLSALIGSHAPRLRLAGAARDGRSALALARQAVIDVIVLDVRLGEEDGLDLLPELRAATGAAVVVLTWSDDAATRARARSLNASAFVAKSAPGPALLAAIHAAAGRPQCHMTNTPCAAGRSADARGRAENDTGSHAGDIQERRR